MTSADRGGPRLTGIARALTAALWVAAALAVAGCGPTHVVVEGEFPRPLIEPMPVTLGVWYDEAFATHEFFDDATGRNETSWIVGTGEAQVQMWDTLLSGMFEKLVHLEGRPGPGRVNRSVDGVLIPHVDELQYAIPAHTSIKVYEIWLRYRFELVTAGGEPIGEWTMTSYGKTPTAFLQSDQEAVNLAAIMALRDAGAHFASSFDGVPAVRDWLRSHGVAVPEAAP